MESLPETLQDKVVEHLREDFEDLRDEEQWNLSFQNTQQSLIMAAQRAKQEISAAKKSTAIRCGSSRSRSNRTIDFRS